MILDPRPLRKPLRRRVSSPGRRAPQTRPRTMLSPFRVELVVPVAQKSGARKQYLGHTGSRGRC